MTVTSRHFTLADYLADKNGTEAHHEIVNGELVEMPPESDENNLIAIYLIVMLSQVIPLQQLRRGTELVVSGACTTIRVPDLMVLTEDLEVALAGRDRSIVLPDMPPPALVIEIVSPGQVHEERDYRYKRSEYAARGIEEYWIVDPKREHIMMLSLVAGLYEASICKDGDRLLSPLFPHLDLTAGHVLRAEF